MKPVLLCLCLGLTVLTACAFNNYDYTGVKVLSTPYDERYRRIEDYLQRYIPVAGTDESSQPASVATPVVPDSPFSPVPRPCLANQTTKKPMPSSQP